MFVNKDTSAINDPAGYLAEKYPGQPVRLLRSACLDEERLPAYLISDINGCGVYSAACLIVYTSEGRSTFVQALELCRDIARDGFSMVRDGVRDYYTRIGREAPYIRKCLKAAAAGYGAGSSIFVKKKAMEELLAGRPVLLNIAFSGQYRDHTVTAYGFEEYAVGERGKKRLFFKVRDGYSKEPRYLEYKGIVGISITYLKEK